MRAVLNYRRVVDVVRVLLVNRFWTSASTFQIIYLHSMIWHTENRKQKGKPIASLVYVQN